MAAAMMKTTSESPALKRPCSVTTSPGKNPGGRVSPVKFWFASEAHPARSSASRPRRSTAIALRGNRVLMFGRTDSLGIGRDEGGAYHTG